MTPLDLDMYLKWSDYYKNLWWGKESKISNCVISSTLDWVIGLQRVIVPKPFIQINGQYMLDQFRCLPETDDIIFGSLSKYMSLLPLQDYGNVVWLDETPQVRLHYRKDCGAGSEENHPCLCV